MRLCAPASLKVAASVALASIVAGARAEEGGPPKQPDPAGTPADRQSGSRLVEASEEIVVIGRLPQPSLPPSKVPAAVQLIDRSELQRAGPASLPDSLAGQVPGFTLSDEQGNSYQPDLSLRGFQATSVTGVPQGVSVFLDGVRVNEPTAEEINFDLLPTEDLARIEVVPGPSVLFGRNTLAGALNLITERGKEGGAAFAEVARGSAGFESYRARLSGRKGPVDLYLSGSETREDGWRDASQARLSKAFGKLGFRDGGTDLTLSYQFVDNRIAQAGPLPASELSRDRAANYTPGDFFAPRLHQLALNVKHDLGDRLTISANGFGRMLHVEQFNVNLAAEDSRLFSHTVSAGSTVQLDYTAPLLGRWNLLTAGFEYAHSDVDVQVFDPELDTHVADRQDTAGAYFQDTFQLARSALRERDELILTTALRWDWVRHRIGDESPARPGREDASGAPAFRRLDPLIGLNYNLSPEHGLYLSFSQGFRAPALLELTCASPAAICPGLQAGTAPDPPLTPVRATNYEIGVRTRPLPWLSGQLSAYRTDVFDDIFSISPAGTTGVYFQNVGKTRRQGIEASLRGKPAGWLGAWATYALTKATFAEDVALATPRPTSDCNGSSCTQHVRAGNEFPLVPRHRAGVGLELQPTGWLSLSLSGTYVSSQWLRGDEENVTSKLDGYFWLDGGVRASAAGFVASIRFTNLLDARYNTFGTFAPNPK